MKILTKLISLFFFISLVGIFVPIITSCSSNKLQQLNRKSADEGIVITKNEDNILPLRNKTISVFGVTQCNSFYGGGEVLKSNSRHIELIFWMD